MLSSSSFTTKSAIWCITISNDVRSFFFRVLMLRSEKIGDFFVREIRSELLFSSKYYAHVNIKVPVETRCHYLICSQSKRQCGVIG
jgi:hypothetical protein